MQSSKLHITDTLWRESTSYLRFSSQRASNAESVFMLQNQHDVSVILVNFGPGNGSVPYDTKPLVELE